MDKDKIIVRRGDIDLRGYEVVRVQFFNFMNIKSVTFSYTGLRFSSECIRRLNCAEYVELFIHPSKKMLAVKPCSNNDKRALRWTIYNNRKIYSRKINGAAFIGTLYEIFDWNTENKYRFRGTVREINSEKVIEFDLNEPEIIVTGNILYNSDWYDRFGIDYYLYKKSDDMFDNTDNINIITYDIEPDIQPTDQEILNDEIHQIISNILKSELSNEKSRDF